MSIEVEPFIWPTNFICTIITDKLLITNQYTLNISIDSVSPADIQMGFRRLRTFVDTSLHNSIFVFKDNPIAEVLNYLDTNKVFLPSEPYDYFVGCVLFRKFQSITEKYFDIGLITIDSAIGDHIQYCIRDPEETGLELAGDHWWNNDMLDTGSDNVLSWEDLDLNDSPKFIPRIIKGGRGENQ